MAVDFVLAQHPAEKKNGLTWSSGGGLVVSVLAYCSEDPSSNPAGY